MQLHAITAAVSWVLGDNHDGFPAAFAQFAQAASPVALAAVWQGAVVALGLVAGIHLAPRVTAAYRFAAWTAGFAVVAALPFLPFVIHLISGSDAAMQLSVAAAASPRTLFQFDSRWALVIGALWLTASALRATQLAFHIRRLRYLWKTSTPIAGSDLPASLVASIPASRPVEICTTRLLDRPSVIGFFAPRILVQSGSSLASLSRSFGRWFCMRPSTCAVATTGPISCRSFVSYCFRSIPHLRGWSADFAASARWLAMKVSFA